MSIGNNQKVNQDMKWNDKEEEKEENVPMKNSYVSNIDEEAYFRQVRLFHSLIRLVTRDESV